MGSPSPSPTINIGVFVPSGAQLLDAACVDIFGTMSRAYLSALGPSLCPASVLAMAQDIQIHWIGSAPSVLPAGSLAEMSAGARLRVTHDISSPEVQPGRLDAILIPGPDPNLKWGDDVLAFLRAHGEHEGTDVLSVCTGIFLCAEAGLVRGKTVCGPRGLQDWIKKGKGPDGKEYGVGKLVGEKYRWWRDGRLWSSGGVTNGNDLVAHYVRTSGRFALPPAELAIAVCEVGDRPQEYEKGQAAWGLGIAWQAVKAYLGLGKPTVGRNKAKGA